MARYLGVLPLNGWSFFTWLDQNFDVQFLNAVQALLSSVIGYVQKPLLAGAVVWIAGMTLVEIYNPSGDPMTALVRKALRAALVIFLVSSAATYNKYFGDLLLNTLPTDITNAIAGGGGKVAAGSFDTLWNGAWATGLQVYKNLPSWSFKSVGMEILVGIYWLVAFGTIAISWLIYVATRVFLGLVVATGPLFVCCLLWPRTARFFEGWVAAAGSLIVTQIFVVALLAMLITTETQLVRQIAGMNVGGGLNADNEVGQLQLLVEAGGMFFVAAYLAKQLPDLARSIMGGIAHNISPYTRAFMSAVGGAAGAVGGAALGGVAGGAGGIASGAASGAARSAAMARGQISPFRLIPAGRAKG